MEFAQNLLATRRGTVIVALLAAALAFVLLFAYLARYRSSVDTAVEETPVLIARTLIPKGTTGDVVGAAKRFELTSVQTKFLKVGALADPASLAGRVAAADIYPGQQLTVTDFTVPAAGAIVPQLVGTERAIAVPFGAGAAAADIQPGDHVDVFVNIDGKMKFLSDNIKVLRVPTPEAATIYLRARGDEAARLALAADTGKLWFVVRPSTKAKALQTGTLDTANLLDHAPVSGGRR